MKRIRSPLEGELSSAQRWTEGVLEHLDVDVTAEAAERPFPHPSAPAQAPDAADRPLKGGGDEDSMLADFGMESR